MAIPESNSTYFIALICYHMRGIITLACKGHLSAVTPKAATSSGTLPPKAAALGNYLKLLSRGFE